MPSFQVLLNDRAWPDTEIERRLLAEVDAELIDADGPEDVLARAPHADAIGTCWAPVGADVIAAAGRCRVVSRFGIGLDNIAVDAATARGIAVTNVPDYCVDEVSDHTLALLLACARKVAFYHDLARRGEYDLGAGPLLRRLRGRTLGLVGFGKIARAVRAKALAFGLRVIAHTFSGHDHGTGCPMVPLDELLVESDFVSLHAPLTPATRHLIGPAELAAMKPDATLINTSRGDLVDADALHAALESGRLAAVALDVHTPEPPDLSDPLYRHDRLIATPHAAFLSVESLTELRTRATRHIVDVLAGRRPQNLVNPPVWRE
jgi:D-3-phosphoglycerate dehydrogenase